MMPSPPTPLRNPNRLKRVTVLVTVGVAIAGLTWFLTTSIFDGMFSWWFAESAETPLPIAERASVSKETQGLLNGYRSTVISQPVKTSQEPTPDLSAEPSETKDLLQKLLNAQILTNAQLQLLIKAHEKPQTPTTATPPPKVETDAERKARAKQARQDYEERINKAKGWKSLSIDPEPPKESPGHMHRLKTPYSLAPNTKINFATEANISNEADGPFIACVTEAVRDSATHSLVVIPQQACFLMRVSKKTIYGDSRLTVEAKSLTFPNGHYLKLTNTSAGDRAGTAGFTDEVDRHIWRTIGGVIMRSALRMGSGVASGLSEGLAAQAGTAVTGEAVSRGMQETQQFLRTDPTISIRSGYLGTLYLEEELVLEEPYDA